jgi:hypothetical protein
MGEQTLMPNNIAPSVRPKRSHIYVAIGCATVLLILVGLIALTYSTLKPRELRVPLVLALPDCKAGVYTKPATAPVDLFDDVGNDAAKRACDGAKGFQGEAVLARNTLILKIHNADSSPLVLAQVRLTLKPKYATAFQREYRLEGRIAPLSDGELRTPTNLDPHDLESMSIFVTWVFFEG